MSANWRGGSLFQVQQLGVMSGNDKHRSRIPLLKGRTTKTSTKGNSYYELERKRRGLELDQLVTSTATRSSRSEAVDRFVKVPVGDDVQSALRNRLQNRNPAISVVPAFMEGQGDEGIKKPVECKLGLFTVTSEGDSASVNKPLPNPKPVQPTIAQEVEPSDISDEKEVTILYENPQSRLTVDLSVDTSEECLESPTNSVMEIITHKSLLTEQTTSTCNLKSAQPLHEMLRDREVCSKTKITEDEEYSKTNSAVDEEPCTKTESGEDEEEAYSKTNSAEEDDDVKLITDSAEGEEDDVKLITNSAEGEEDVVKLNTNSAEDEDVKLETNSAEDEDVKLEINAAEDEDVKLETNSAEAEDEDVKLNTNSAEDEDVKLETNSAEDEYVKLKTNSAEDEDVKLKTNITEQDGCSSSVLPVEYSTNLHEQENALYCEESKSEEFVILDNESSMEFGDQISCYSFEQRHEEQECLEEEVANADNRTPTDEEPDQFTATDTQTSPSNEDSVSAGLLIKKVLSSNLDISVKQIISNIICNATSVIEDSPSDSINSSNSNESFTVERIQLSEVESDEKDNSSSEINWIQHFKAQYDHEHLLDTFVTIKDCVAEDISPIKLTKKDSEGWHEEMKIFADKEYNHTTDSEDSLSVNSEPFQPSDEIETKSSPVKMRMHPSPESIDLVPKNFKEMIAKKHQIQKVVPKKVVLSKKVQKRGVADKIIYSGSFVITNPTDSVIAFESSCNESANPHRFHLTPSRGLLQAREATEVTVAVPYPHLTETLLGGSRLLVRVLPIHSRITEAEELATLFRRNRQQDNPQGKAFKIIPVVEEEPDENFDLDEMRLREKNTSTCHNIRVMINQMSSELRGVSWGTRFGATLFMTLIGMYFIFGVSIPLFYSTLLSQAFH